MTAGWVSRFRHQFREKCQNLWYLKKININNIFNIAIEKSLPGDDVLVPYYIVWNIAFGGLMPDNPYIIRKMKHSSKHLTIDLPLTGEWFSKQVLSFAKDYEQSDAKNMKKTSQLVWFFTIFVISTDWDIQHLKHPGEVKLEP